MQNYIALYPNAHEKEFNMEFLTSAQDTPLEDFVIACMRDFEQIENIEILDYKIIKDEDEVNLNNHMVNINYKKKDIDNIEIPQFKYMTDSRFGEIVFRIRIHTNKNERIITKRILIPLEHDGYYINNGKKMKAIWQLIDASTYSQRGKLTLKARMPIIIYHNKHRVTSDVHGEEHILPSYSYALDTVSKRRGPASGKRAKAKFINPLMIYSAKMGFARAAKFFGMDGVVKLTDNYDDEDDKWNYIFAMNDMFIVVDKFLFDKYHMIRSYVCMVVNLANRDFPVTEQNLEDREYWTCRIGYIGSAKNSNIYSFYEKGRTTIYMIERLMDESTIDSLRLPNLYKTNVYYLIYWIICNYDDLKSRNNISMDNKRIRKHEYMVKSSLGKKISENMNKFIERKSKSKMNTIETLLELFNFNSDIIVTGMRNLNDLIKSDDTVNDMTFLSDLSYSSKGPNSLGENGSKVIASKYRHLHPSMVGVLDIFTTSNSDCGRSGAFTPFVKLYDRYFFTPEKEPCQARYLFDKSMEEENHGVWDADIDLSTFESYIECLERKAEFAEDLKYEIIEIVEREDDIK